MINANNIPSIERINGNCFIGNITDNDEFGEDTVTVDFVVNTTQYLAIFSLARPIMDDEDEESTFGLWDSQEQFIYVYVDQSKPKIYKTILHELTHAYLHEYGFGISPVFNEEEICNFMEAYGERIVEDATYIYDEYFKVVSSTHHPFNFAKQGEYK